MFFWRSGFLYNLKCVLIQFTKKIFFHIIFLNTIAFHVCVSQNSFFSIEVFFCLLISCTDIGCIFAWPYTFCMSFYNKSLWLKSHQQNIFSPFWMYISCKHLLGFLLNFPEFVMISEDLLFQKLEPYFAKKWKLRKGKIHYITERKQLSETV